MMPITISSGTSSPLSSSALHLQAERRARRDGGAQHVAGGELRQAALLGEDFGLRALARPRRPEQNQIQRRAPRSFDFLMRPSYCCAIRWLWICATVSIVTLTTIRIEVPPSENGQVVLVEQEFRDQADDGQIERADHRDARERIVDVLRRSSCRAGCRE